MKSNSYDFITELCSILQCPEEEICVLENGKPECKITEEGNSYFYYIITIFYSIKQQNVRTT